jgi:hypothetical protein
MEIKGHWNLAGLPVPNASQTIVNVECDQCGNPEMWAWLQKPDSWPCLQATWKWRTQTWGRGAVVLVSLLSLGQNTWGHQLIIRKGLSWHRVLEVPWWFDLMAGAWSDRVSSSLHGQWEAQREREKRPASHNPLQGHAHGDLTSSH